MPSNRFSKQAIIQRYLRDKHGYLLIAMLLISAHAFFDGPYDMSGPHAPGYRQLASLLTPIFGGHSDAALFLIIAVLLILYIELVVFNRIATKENQK